MESEDIVRFYQQLGFFTKAEPATIIKQFSDDHGLLPNSDNKWDDVFLLAYAKDKVWADDPEADVCAENKIYQEVLPEWAHISHGAFAPYNITEQWESDSGPITVWFQLGERLASVSPNYQDDWIDLKVLRQINRLIDGSGRQFECSSDGNFALVLCLTSEQKQTMRTKRQFPFRW